MLTPEGRMTAPIVAAFDPAGDDGWLEEEVSLGRHCVSVRRPASAEALIDEAAFAIDERLPYWAELWPSAHALAEAVLGRCVAGLRVVELGCGIGLPGIVAALEGGVVTLTDWYEDALAAAEQNARRSGAVLEARLLDWRSPPGELLVRPFDLVIAADVLYEARNAEWLAALLPRLVASNGEVIIADPRRPDAQTLVGAMVDRGWSHIRSEHRVQGPVDESGPLIHLHRLRPANDPYTDGSARLPVAVPR